MFSAPYFSEVQCVYFFVLWCLVSWFPSDTIEQLCRVCSYRLVFLSDGGAKVCNLMAEKKITYFTSSFTSYLHLTHYPPWFLFKSWHGWLGTWNANWRAALSGCIKEGGSYSLEHLLGLGKEKKQIGTIILWLTQLLALWLDACSYRDHCIHLKQSPACNGHMVIAIEWEVTLNYRHMKDTFKKNPWQKNPSVRANSSKINN